MECGLLPLELVCLGGAGLLIGALVWVLPEEGRRSRIWLDLLLVVAVAAAARIAFLALYPELSRAADSWEYLRRAGLLATGDATFLWDPRWHRWSTWTRPPGYFLFLAGIQSLFEDWRTAIVWIQAALSVLSAAATYLVALPLFGRRAAIAAGLVFALYPEVVLTVSLALTEPLYMALLLAALAALARLSARPSAGWALAAGALFGLAAHVRSAPVFFVPLAAALLLPAHGWRRGWRPAVLLVVATLATVAPWSIRNSILLGHPMGLDDMSVINLLQVSPDEAVFSTAGADLATHEGYREYYARLKRANRGGELTRRGGEILLRGLGRMASRPVETVERFGVNLARFFSLHDPSLYGDILSEPRPCRARLLADLTNGAYVVVLLVGLAALGPALRRRAAWPILAWFFFNLVVINLVFHPEPKYRLPLLPVAMVVAGLGVARGADLLRRWLPTRRGRDGPDPPR